jgi:hypothetical protein
MTPEVSLRCARRVLAAEGTGCWRSATTGPLRRTIFGCRCERAHNFYEVFCLPARMPNIVRASMHRQGRRGTRSLAGRLSASPKEIVCTSPKATRPSPPAQQVSRSLHAQIYVARTTTSSNLERSAGRTGGPMKLPSTSSECCRASSRDLRPLRFPMERLLNRTADSDDKLENPPTSESALRRLCSSPRLGLATRDARRGDTSRGSCAS